MSMFCDCAQAILEFEKVNVNTLVWQSIAVITLLLLFSDIRRLFNTIINKVLQVKTFGFVEFSLSSDTIDTINQNKERLNNELIPYKEVAEQDANMVFLTHFISFESDLRELHAKVFSSNVLQLQTKAETLLGDLIKEGIVSKEAYSIFSDVKFVRNKIAHGQKVLSSELGAESYLRAVIMLRDLIKEGFSRFLKRR